MTAQTPQEQLDYLLESVWHPTNKPVTVAEIVDAVGSDAARLVVGTLQAGAGVDPLLASSWQAISTVGMLLSSLERQSEIDHLAVVGKWPDAVRDQIKALGGSIKPRWQALGMAAAPTLNSIAAEIADASEAVHRQRARLAGVRFGELMAIDGDAAATMAAIWEAMQ